MGRGALQEKCKSTAAAVANAVKGLGKCVGFSMTENFPFNSRTAATACSVGAETP
jgi:hypothetical protein